MNIKTLPVGQLETNCYVVVNEQRLECVVIDPGDESNTILDYIEDNKLKCCAIMLTHGHYDHVGAVMEIMEQTGCEMYINPRDEGYEPGMSGMKFKMPEGGKYYDDGDVVKAAGLEFKVLATPGHTPGGVCLICGNALFTGDTLFDNSYGRTDFPTGDDLDMLRSLKRLMMETEGNPTVYPGHETTCTMDSARLFLRRLIRGEMMNL